MNVNLEELAEVMAYLDQINNIELADIVWLKGGHEIEISADTIEEWKFMGLSNKDFAYFNLQEYVNEKP